MASIFDFPAQIASLNHSRMQLMKVICANSASTKDGILLSEVDGVQ
jgi:hypothetical protein